MAFITGSQFTREDPVFPPTLAKHTLGRKTINTKLNHNTLNLYSIIIGFMKLGPNIITMY